MPHRDRKKANAAKTAAKIADVSIHLAKCVNVVLDPYRLYTDA
jgi:hypothetical protein